MLANHFKGPQEPPECDQQNKCRFISRGSSRTLMGWTPTYDREGNMIGKDPNRTTSYWQCGTCDKGWKEVS